MAQFTVMRGRKMPKALIQDREETIQGHFQNLHQGRNHADAAHQA